MIRLVLLLCGCLYLALMVLGQDHGQKRYGLMLAEQQAQTPAIAPPPPPQPEVYIPAQTVMVTSPLAAPEPLPEPEIPGGRLLTVAALGANVRQGPGTSFDVVGSLAQGEQVLVVDEDAPVAGWSRVRLEGDGVEGYIATRLLSE